MALTSSSTYAEAKAQYLDNLSWEGDLAKARAFLEAIRFILLQRPQRSSYADGRAHDYADLEVQQARVERWLETHDSTNRPRASLVQGRLRAWP